MPAYNSYTGYVALVVYNSAYYFIVPEQVWNKKCSKQPNDNLCAYYQHNKLRWYIFLYKMPKVYACIDNYSGNDCYHNAVKQYAFV